MIRWLAATKEYLHCQWLALWRSSGMFSCVGDGRWPICAGDRHTISLFSSHLISHSLERKLLIWYFWWPRLFCVIFQGSCMEVAFMLHACNMWMQHECNFHAPFMQLLWMLHETFMQLSWISETNFPETWKSRPSSKLAKKYVACLWFLYVPCVHWPMLLL